MIKTVDLISKFEYALRENWGYIWGTAGVKWTEARQHQLEQTTDPVREQSRKYGMKWIGHTVADCSGLFRWAFRQLGGDIAHGSNSIYDRYCSSHGSLKKGKTSGGQELEQGTAVFTGTSADRKHIGLYVGNGKVIEAKNTQSGVIESSVYDERWTWWGKLKDVEYEEEKPAPEPEPVPEPDPAEELPTLRRGSKGEYVRKAQQLLKAKGYSLGPCGVDGDYGSATEKAVRAFQRDWGLATDGVIGPKTWAMLQSTPDKETTYAVTITGLDKTQAQAIVNKYLGHSEMREE